MQVDQYLQGFSQLSAPKPTTKGKSIEQLAKQFEGQFFSLLLKSARATSNAMGGDFLNGREMQFRQENFDQMLAQKMAGGPLYDHFVTALSRQFKVENNVQSSPPSNKSIPLVSTPKPAISVKETDLVGDIYNIAKQFAKQLGVSPKVIWAQSMLETGWGKHMPSSESNNLFGIKAKPGDQADTVSTNEVINGVVHRIKAPFKRYESMVESFKDYVDLVANSPRYAKALSASSDSEYIQELQRAGYATDPNYADKVMNIMQSDRAKELN